MVYLYSIIYFYPLLSIGYRTMIEDAPSATRCSLKLQRRGDLLFPGQKYEQSLSNMTMLKVLQRLNYPYTPHGFRSTFRTWISEKTNHAHEVAEAALAHTIGDKVVAAYQRGDLFEKRRQLMMEWSDFVSEYRPKPEKVYPDHPIQEARDENSF